MLYLHKLTFFFREQERKVGPEGFLDSSRYSHSFVVKKEKDKQQKPVRKSMDSPIVQVTHGRSNVVSFSARVEKDTKNHRKRMKVIEVSLVIIKEKKKLYLKIHA